MRIFSSILRMNGGRMASYVIQAEDLTVRIPDQSRGCHDVRNYPHGHACSRRDFSFCFRINAFTARGNLHAARRLVYDLRCDIEGAFWSQRHFSSYLADLRCIYPIRHLARNQHAGFYGRYRHRRRGCFVGEPIRQVRRSVQTL